MVFLVIGVLILGILCGQYLFTSEIVVLLNDLSGYILYLLMFSVGLSVGTNKTVFRKMRAYHFYVLVIPFGIIIGSLVGGAVCSWILKTPLIEGLSIVSGLGWYSLSGVLLGASLGAEVGTLAFMSNLLREILSFVSIPFIVKHFNTYTAIAPAAATSEDTTLPILMKYANEETVLLAVFNGVICSLAVPVLIKIIDVVL